MRRAKTRLIALLLLGLLATVQPASAVAKPCCEVWAPPVALVESGVISAQTSAQIAEWVAKAKSWVTEFTLLADIISWTGILDEVIDADLNTLANLFSGGQSAEAEADTRLHEGLGEANAQIGAAETAAKAVGEKTPPAPQNQQLCNIITARQGPIALNWFTRMLAAKITDEIGNRYRGPGADGSGPQYAADERDLRCGKKDGVKTANPLDGYPASCVPDDPDLIDADLKVPTYDMVLVMPPLLPQTITTASGPVTINVPTPYDVDDDGRVNEDYKQQQQWVAAVNYCYFAAGPRPTPPSGADLNSPEGIARTAMFDRVQALESAFVAQCAHRVAYLTRATCDEKTVALCVVGSLACVAARDAGVELPPGVSCSSGLSEYQAELLSHLICMSNQTVSAEAGAGENHGKLMNDIGLCQWSMSKWQQRLARDSAKLTSALKALKDMRRNYANIGRVQGKFMNIYAPSMTPQDSQDGDRTVERGRSASVKPAAMVSP